MYGSPIVNSINLQIKSLFCKNAYISLYLLVVWYSHFRVSWFNAHCNVV